MGQPQLERHLIKDHWGLTSVRGGSEIGPPVFCNLSVFFEHPQQFGEERFFLWRSRNRGLGRSAGYLEILSIFLFVIIEAFLHRIHCPRFGEIPDRFFPFRLFGGSSSSGVRLWFITALSLGRALLIGLPGFWILIPLFLSCLFQLLLILFYLLFRSFLSIISRCSFFTGSGAVVVPFPACLIFRLTGSAFPVIPFLFQLNSFSYILFKKAILRIAYRNFHVDVTFYGVQVVDIVLASQ